MLLEKQIVIRFDRDALAEYGLTAQFMVSFVGQYVTSSSRGRVTYGGEEIDFLVKVKGFDQRDVIELENAMVATYSGNRVRMKDVSTISVEKVMDRIERKDQQYSRTVPYGGAGPGRGHGHHDPAKRVRIRRERADLAE